MNRRKVAISSWFTLLALLAGLFTWTATFAIDPDEVRPFEEVFVISGHAPDRHAVEVTWEIAPDYYLYNNRFLEFTMETAGVVMGQPQVPRGEMGFDDLLGEEVEKYHDRLTVVLPLLSVDAAVSGVRLKVRSQGCLENVLCYPPTEQVLLVGLPASDAPAPGSTPGTEAETPPPGSLEDTAAKDQAAPLRRTETFPGLGTGPLDGLAKSAAGAPALDAESAFVYEAIGLSAETVLVRFTAQPGYYLYREKFAFRVADASDFSVRDVSLPEGVIKDDPEFGSVPVIYGQVEIPVRLNRPAGPATTISLQANFQGCRDGEICYPPQSRIVSFEMPPAPVAFGDSLTAAADVPVQGGTAAVPVSEQDQLAGLLTHNPGKAIFAFFIAGVLLAFTPCVFPMVPILSGIILGQGARLTTLRSFWLSVVYVLAMAVTYTVAGVLAGLFGQNLQAVFQDPWILSGFVAVFVLLALSMFGFFELQLPARFQSHLVAVSNHQKGGHLWGVAVMGFLSALIVGPCVAPPLMAALIVIGTSGDAVLGGSALFALSLGMGLPLILFGVSAGKLAPKAGAWMETVKSVFGVGLLALAIWMLERILPGALIMLLWGVLAISCGVYLGALEPIAAASSGWKRLWKAVGVTLLLLGAIELVGVATGADDWLRPLSGLRAGGTALAAEDQAEFRRIKSAQELGDAVKTANEQGQGAMLDFYADWCVECLRMERNTFPEADVQALLSRMQPLQADVTANDETDQALMRQFGIIGPPAILFFDRSGREMKPWRLVGYFTPAEFAKHLDGVLAAQ